MWVLLQLKDKDKQNQKQLYFQLLRFCLYKGLASENNKQLHTL